MRTLQEQLTEKGLSDARIQEIEKPNTNMGKRQKETLSRKEWEEIMGVNRETYQKQGGTYRRKR